MTNSPPALLTSAERAALPALLPRWQVGEAALRRAWRFADFAAAWGFMARVALLAEAQGHHPDWRNAWNLVEITLTTHEAGGLTARDLALALAIDRLG